jgi:hypothetical protein
MEWIPARVTNPAPLHNKLEKESNMASRKHRRGGPRLSAAAKRLLAGSRKANPKKKRSVRRQNPRLVAGSAEAKKRMAYLRSLKKKRTANGRKRRRNPAAAGVAGAIQSAIARSANGKKRRSVRRGRSHSLSMRAANGKSRRLHRVRRHRNPGFDLKKSLIQSAVLVAGVLAAAKIVPMIEGQINKITGLNAQTQGYIKLLGAAATIVGGDYLADKFGSKIGFDVRPATYAIATYMAISGLRGAGFMDGTVVLSGPLMAGMSGTMGYLNGPLTPVLPNYMEPNAMLGSIALTPGDLPGSPISAHNVMQGYGSVQAPQMC